MKGLRPRGISGAWRRIATLLLAAALPVAAELLPCGERGARPMGPERKAGRQLALEHDLAVEGFTHCAYFLERACLEWESGDPGSGWQSFEMAYRFCDDKTVPARGRVAARLAGGDYAGAYAAWKAGSRAGAAESLALAGYAPAVYGGLSLTDFPVQGPVEWRQPPGPWDPERAWRLSLLPGAGYLYLGEGQLALQHLVLGAGLSTLVGWRLWGGWRGDGNDFRMAAFLDAGLLALLWKRYYLGGMEEARRLAREKNRGYGAGRVRALWVRENPFRSMGPERALGLPEAPPRR